MDSKYRTIFAAKVKAIEQPDEEILLEAKASVKEAAASLHNLKLLAADINPEDDPDLLYVVANLAVAGKVNLNDDAVTCEDALAFYKRFEKKFVDIEHNRAHCVGFIVKAGLSEFGTDRIITEEEARNLPYFNITTVSALWKSVNRPLCNLIIDASNPKSPTYRDISLSFEVGFGDYEIGVGSKGERDLSKVKKMVKSGEEFDALSKRLRAHDGNGLTEDGNDILFRVLKGDIVPLGQGIVTVPAAQVKGIQVIEDKDTEMDDDEDDMDGGNKMTMTDKEIECFLAKINANLSLNGKALASTAIVAKQITQEATQTQKIEEKSIKNTPSGVSTTINANKTMKYNTLEEIEKNWSEIVKPEVATDVSFASARDLFTATILAESKRIGEEAKVNKELAAKAKTDAEAAIAAHNEALKTLAEVKAELDAYKVKQAEAEAQAKFNERMTAISEKFVFSDEERAIIVSKIRGLNDDEFKTWSTEADVLYKEKTKAYKDAEATKLRDAVKAGLEKAGIKASVGEKDVNFAEIFASVKVEDSAIQNNLEVQTNTVKDSMKAAFGNISLTGEKKK